MHFLQFHKLFTIVFRRLHKKLKSFLNFLQWSCLSPTWWFIHSFLHVILESTNMKKTYQRSGLRVKAPTTSDRHSKNDNTASYEIFMNILDIPSLLSLSSSLLSSTFHVVSSIKNFSGFSSLLTLYEKNSSNSCRAQGAQGRWRKRLFAGEWTLECGMYIMATSFTVFLIWIQQRLTSYKIWNNLCCWSNFHQKI